MKKPGRYADGNGLYLQVAKGGSKSWLFRYMSDGKARAMGLGPVGIVTLADARDQAIEARRRLLAGVDPIEAKEAGRRAANLEVAKSITFKEAAEKYIDVHKSGWRNAKHSAQWESTLQTYVYPVIGSLGVAAIDTGLVLKVIEPIWQTKTETASRVRSRIENILDWAKVRGYREGENPARWRGHLDKSLPARSKVRKIEHYKALPFTEVGAFVAELRKREAIAARALDFAILTACRTGEVLGVDWSEINLEQGIWIIPADRMKAGREHRVPLSKQALAILKRMGDDFAYNGYVFPGQKAGKPLSGMAFAMILRRMERQDITAHGFRSTFRDWAAESTAYPREVAEMALAHAIGDKVEAAYRRGDLFEKRRRLMQAWANYCDRPTTKANVVAIKSA